MNEARWEAAWRGLAMLVLGASLGYGANTLAADFPEAIERERLPPAPRFFPRSDGSESMVPSDGQRRRYADCTPRRAFVPSDAPDDPSYVGSPYGLRKPSYYGFRPALGHDDPFGRPLRYCP